jgi:hypothetical protein
MWSSTSGEPLSVLVQRASACALELLRVLDFYQGGFDTTLRLHLGLGAVRGVAWRRANVGARLAVLRALREAAGRTSCAGAGRTALSVS